MFDVILIGIIGVFTLLGLIRGFNQEISSVILWFGSAIFTQWLQPVVRPIVQSHFDNVVASYIISYFSTYIFFLIVIIIFTTILRSILCTIIAPSINHILGLLIGAIKGYLISTIIYIGITVVYPRLINAEEPRWIAEMQTKFLFDTSTALISQFFPKVSEDDQFANANQFQNSVTVSSEVTSKVNKSLPELLSIIPGIDAEVSNYKNIEQIPKPILSNLKNMLEVPKLPYFITKTLDQYGLTKEQLKQVIDSKLIATDKSPPMIKHLPINLPIMKKFMNDNIKNSEVKDSNSKKNNSSKNGDSKNGDSKNGDAKNKGVLENSEQQSNIIINTNNGIIASHTKSVREKTNTVKTDSNSKGYHNSDIQKFDRLIDSVY